MSSIQDLAGHHGDFAAFRDLMVETSAGRFGPLWWGVWDSYVEHAETVVDLGTGPGLLLPLLRRRLPGSRLVGVDMQPEMLATAQRHAEEAGAELIEADLAGPVPLPDACADVVTVVMVFHELAFPPPLLDECLRLLRPGGRLLLYDWVKRPLRDYLGEEVLDESHLQHFREHCLFSGEDLEFLLERAGFSLLERVDRRGGRFAIVVAEKPGDGP